VSLTTRVLIALAAGLAGGIVVSQSNSPALATVVGVVEPIGTLFINAIRMTVIPLVVGSLIVGVASAPDARAVGRVGRGAIVFFVVALFLSAGIAAVLSPPIFARIPLDPAATAALRASAVTAATAAGESVKRIPTFAQWLVDLVPINPVKAAADGAMLPLIVFAVIFGLAATRIAPEKRLTLIGFFRGVSDAALTLVRWILALAPIGVFALALPLAARLGLSAAGALVGYIVLVAVMTTAFAALVLYPAASLLGGVSIGEFARAALPAQAVAFSARSSLAALPAMIESSRTKLHLPETITSFFLPLAASTFRVAGAMGQVVGVLFIARLYGITLDAGQLLTVVTAVVLTTFSVPGVPAGSIIVMVPVLLAANVPPEGIGILLGVDTIPDMFRTTGNVTGDLAAGVILGRRTKEAEVRMPEATVETG
jgi:Na+/H+-dicarboxylate symporter